MLDRGLLPDFSAAALAELGRIQGPAVAKSGDPVRDLRDLLWASIDNDDSLDLDQLTVAEAMPRDNVKILVAIADVDALVKNGSAIDQHARHNTTSVYTAAEIARCRGRVPELAVRFAAKEAVSKALGIGIWWPGGIAWHEAEVRSDPLGKPEVVLHGRAAERARELGLDWWAISLSHSDDNAIAMVVAMHQD